MRDVLEYIRELFREARDDRFFSWIGSSFKYVFYIAPVVFLVYQGYSMYTRSLEAKRMRFADAFVTLQHAFDEFVNEENNEEKRKKFLDNYANLSNAMEPYGTLATLYLALFYERTGQKDLVASTLLEHSQKVDSKFWNDLCFLVAQRFAVPIQCKQNSGLFGTRAFVESITNNNGDPLSKAVSEHQYLHSLFDRRLDETLKKLLRKAIEKQTFSAN